MKIAFQKHMTLSDWSITTNYERSSFLFDIEATAGRAD